MQPKEGTTDCSSRTVTTSFITKDTHNTKIKRDNTRTEGSYRRDLAGYMYADSRYISTRTLTKNLTQKISKRSTILK